jgi:ADP-heptose:LPS heptosyltransferase
VSDRSQDLYRETVWSQAWLPPVGVGSRTGLAAGRPAEAAATWRIAIAPFSNSDLRDWPFAHYVALVRLLIGRLDCTVTLLGARAQAGSLDRLAQEAGGGEAGGGARVRNLGGQTAWSDMPEVLRAADLVICNNSGIAHLAAACGARTLAIYSASHQPQEWGPRGPHSHALMAVVPCSPCGYDRLEDCPYEHRCMRGLVPETVFAEAVRLLAERAVPAMAPHKGPVRN